MAHVYNPSRLSVLAQCAHGTGIIEIIRVEADGDYHVLVHMDPTSLDPNGGHWVNTCNATCAGGAEHGDLVTEPVCENTVTQPDAVSACQGYVNPQGLPPPVGTHVRVSGPWVLDTTHGWQEIHPATFEVLPAIADPMQGSDD
jgi:hypothetical protein